MSDLSVHYSSKNECWNTPKNVKELVIRFLGEIDLDPCADNEKTVQANRYFTKEDNCLEQSWIATTVFMNPPYGNPENPCSKNCAKGKCAQRGHHVREYIPGIIDFIERGIAEYRLHHYERGVFLVPARTDTRWFSYLYDFPICFVSGRLKFINPSLPSYREDGNFKVSPAPFPSALVGLGVDEQRFKDIFGTIGTIVKKV